MIKYLANESQRMMSYSNEFVGIILFRVIILL